MGDMKLPVRILQPDDIDFDAYMSNKADFQKVRPASEFLNDTLYALRPMHERPDCLRIPFGGFWVYCAPGHTTLWAGRNRSGKSLLNGQVMSHFVIHGKQKVCLASLEMRPGDTLARMVRQHAVKADPLRDDVMHYLGATQGGLWLYNQMGFVPYPRMLAVMRAVAAELGIQHFVLDNLMKVVKGTEDYDAQKEFIDGCTVVARDTGMHIHIVLHMKKGENEDNRIPTQADIKGTSEIVDLPDTAILLWRNKKKEKQRDAGQEVDPNDPDAMLICDKQRHNGGWEGRVRLWYEPASMRFRDTPLGGFSPRKEKA